MGTLDLRPFANESGCLSRPKQTSLAAPPTPYWNTRSGNLRGLFLDASYESLIFGDIYVPPGLVFVVFSIGFVWGQLTLFVCVDEGSSFHDSAFRGNLNDSSLFLKPRPHVLWGKIVIDSIGLRCHLFAPYGRG